jgi:hypothetical protein
VGTLAAAAALPGSSGPSRRLGRPSLAPTEQRKPYRLTISHAPGDSRAGISTGKLLISLKSLPYFRSWVRTRTITNCLPRQPSPGGAASGRGASSSVGTAYVDPGRGDERGPVCHNWMDIQHCALPRGAAAQTPGSEGGCGCVAWHGLGAVAIPAPQGRVRAAPLLSRLLCLGMRTNVTSLRVVTSHVSAARYVKAA